MPRYIETLEHCIEQNAIFFQKVALTVAEDWGVAPSPASWEKSQPADYLKVKSTLKQLMREWSSEGDEERDVSFGEIVRHLERKYPDVNKRSEYQILIPGVGLGRLTFELVKRGFRAQGNEFSYYMLFLSNFILNHTFAANIFQVFPFIHSTSNQRSRDYQTRPIYVPDQQPSAELQLFQGEYPGINVPDLMSITSGSFTDLYGPNDLQISQSYSNDVTAQNFRAVNKGHFDVIITVFFLDTASNIIEYLKTVRHALKSSGEWINFGPLLWHFEDDNGTQKVVSENGKSINVPFSGLELTKDDQIELVERFFTLETEKVVANVRYGSDVKSFGRWTYDCQYWRGFPKDSIIDLKPV